MIRWFWISSSRASCRKAILCDCWQLHLLEFPCWISWKHSKGQRLMMRNGHLRLPWWLEYGYQWSTWDRIYHSRAMKHHPCCYSWFCTESCTWNSLPILGHWHRWGVPRLHKSTSRQFCNPDRERTIHLTWDRFRRGLMADNKRCWRWLWKRSKMLWPWRSSW